MLRDPNLVPLSHQHQHALALCVRLERGLRSSGADLARWHSEVAQLFDEEMQYHFAAEERVLFPAAARLPELRELVGELLGEHASLAAAVDSARTGSLSASELLAFAGALTEHVRKEERQLFERLQAALTAPELTRIGAGLADYFRSSGMPPSLEAE